MATLPATVPPVLNKAYTGSTNQGQSAGYAPATVTTGDLIPLTGRATLLSVKTTGTACTATLDSVAPSSYGGDQDVTLVLAATDEQHVLIQNDGRFDQGASNAGYAKVTCSVVTGVFIRATVIPGSV
jgi:hypothetical protein